jgi:methyl-accepting chemotaxis protein
MMIALHHAVLPAQAVPPDTVAVLTPSGPLATAEAISSIVLAVGLLLVLGGLLALFLQLRSLTRELASVARKVQKEAAPVLDRARSVAENVEFISMSVRTDVQRLTESVARLNDRLKQASDRMEERIQDFNALVEVMQSEAEGLALDTAAAVRGLRAGTGSLAARPGESAPLPPGTADGEEAVVGPEREARPSNASHEPSPGDGEA